MWHSLRMRKAYLCLYSEGWPLDLFTLGALPVLLQKIESVLYKQESPTLSIHNHPLAEN